jgi:hypothetical protein
VLLLLLLLLHMGGGATGGAGECPRAAAIEGIQIDL